jgi:YggT family protein
MNPICTIANLYVLIIVLRAISSFFPIAPGSPFAPVVRFLYQATEPVFQPIRRVLPTMGAFDFTPLVVLIGVRLVAGLLGC